MKYMHRNVVVMLTIFLFITACSSGERIKEISDVKPGDFKKYAGTYVGNNADVVAIFNHLPGGETFQSISLENESIKVNYGAKENGILTEDMVETYWFDGKDTMKKNFLFNAIYLVILVPNAKSYEFQVKNKKFTIKREEILPILYENFNDFPKEDDMWDEKKVVKFLNDNNEK
ncbi:group-specific protein [Bacillus cereus]|nr:group-specific protein [Bacillus cereus]